MKDLNTCTLSGRLTRDAELRYTSQGTGVLNFSIANNRPINRNGEWDEKANFIDCTLFGGLAEKIVERMRKGVQVSLVGRLDYQAWEKDGNKHSKIVVLVDELRVYDDGAGAGQAREEAMAYEDIEF